DSQAPNDVFYEWLLKGNLFSENAKIRREVSFSSSRFDLFAEDGDKKAFIEVKGVTLEEDGICKFPDAPTQRGIKHIEELVRAKEIGFEAYIVFIIQMREAKLFTPNVETHPEFSKALKKARENGVKILAYTCSVSPDGLEIKEEVPILL
ncbi:MAG: DNA/RNA nuclease SfsA, partial [Clostridia bacterium]|nr:DNA/RNA nuclease SfsA [Clostridia bacterium]